MRATFGFAVLWVVSTVAAACGGYVWGFRLIERVLSRPIDHSQTVEGLFMHPVSYRPGDPAPVPATPFKLQVPRYARISETSSATGSLTGPPSEFVRASLAGGRLTIVPEGDTGPLAPAFNSWKWTITPTELGEVFVQATVKDLQQKGSPDVFIAKIIVQDEFGFTRLGQRVVRVMASVLALGIVQCLFVVLRSRRSRPEGSEANL